MKFATYVNRTDLKHRFTIGDEDPKTVRLVESAIAHASSVHKKTKRLTGERYMEGHVFPVVYNLIRFLSVMDAEKKRRATGHEPSLFNAVLDSKRIVRVCRLMLHDSLEELERDRRVYLLDSFGNEIAAGVSALTKPSLPEQASESKKRMRDDKYHEILGILGEEHPDLIEDKLIDRCTNLYSLPGPRVKWQKKRISHADWVGQQIEETERVYVPLASGPKIHPLLKRELETALEHARNLHAALAGKNSRK